MMDISDILVSFWLLPVCGLIFPIACRLSCIFWTCEVSFESASCTSVNCSAISGKLQVVLLPNEIKWWRNIRSKNWRLNQFFVVFHATGLLHKQFLEFLSRFPWLHQVLFFWLYSQMHGWEVIFRGQICQSKYFFCHFLCSLRKPYQIYNVYS